MTIKTKKVLEIKDIRAVFVARVNSVGTYVSLSDTEQERSRYLAQKEILFSTALDLGINLKKFED